VDTLFVSNNDEVIHDPERENNAPEIYSGVSGASSEAGAGWA
jgi:hypothetical protein